MKLPNNKFVGSFLAESNRIEGITVSREEFWARLEAVNTYTADLHLNNSVKAYLRMIRYAKHDTPLTIDTIHDLHYQQMNGLLSSEEKGAFRMIQVYVGNHTPPKPEFVPVGMDQFVDRWNKRDGTPFELHCEFEYIHPYVDGNGRVGRLLWLWDKIRRGEEPTTMLAGFATPGMSFKQARQAYYDALQLHHDSTKVISAPKKRGTSEESKAVRNLDIEVGALLRTHRERRGMSQLELGGYIGVSFQQIQKYERGINRISTGKIITFAHHLGVEPGDLLPKLKGGTEVAGVRPQEKRIIRRMRSMDEENLSLLEKMVAAVS